MPREFNRAVMTNNGADLLNRAQSGDAVLEFTRMAIGDGVYTDEETTVEAMQKMTDLKSGKYSYPISGKSVESPRCLKLTSVFGNAVPGVDEAIVTEGFFINEIGLYCMAKDEDDSEVLYSVTTVVGGYGDYMPPYNGKNRAEIIQDWYATITNDGIAYIQNSSSAFATMDYVDSLMARSIGFDGSLSNSPYDNVQDVLDAILLLLDPMKIQQAFVDTFTYFEGTDLSASMSAVEVNEAIQTRWDGQSSTDPTAMNAAEVEEAIQTRWNGQSSTDPTAISAVEIEEAIR